MANQVFSWILFCTKRLLAVELLILSILLYYLYFLYWILVFSLEASSSRRNWRLRQEKIHLKLKGRTLGFEYLCPSPARVSPKKTKLTFKKPFKKFEKKMYSYREKVQFWTEFDFFDGKSILKLALTRRNSDRRYTNKASKPFKLIF